MTRAENTIEIARRTFADIQSRFPHLQTTVDAGAPVELSVTLQVQPGLKYKVNLNLQNNDELHFSASHFSLEWFPCTDSARVDDYIAAVSGFLSGVFRIVEHYRGHTCAKAELQSPKDAGWKTIGIWANRWVLLPWGKKHLVVVRNNLD